MCYRYKNDAPKNQLEGILKKTLVPGVDYRPGEFNGFDHPFAPIITNLHPDHIQLFVWGLIPHWAKDRRLQNNTLNARLETLAEKPSFKYSLDQRCLIPATSFFEWKWLDPKGKIKQKYQIHQRGLEVFCFAGLYSNWTDRSTGEIIPTFTLITREAEGIMREIHNSKLRMPMIVSPEQWDSWLDGTIDIADPPVLEAEEV